MKDNEEMNCKYFVYIREYTKRKRIEEKTKFKTRKKKQKKMKQQ